MRRDPNWATLFCTLDTSSGNVFKKGAASNACRRVATDEFSSLNCKKYYKWFEGKGRLFMSIIVTDCNCSSKLMKYYSLTWLNMASNWLTRTVMFFLICVWFEDKIDNWLRNWWLLSLIILRSSTTETRKKWINNSCITIPYLANMRYENILRIISAYNCKIDIDLKDIFVVASL